MYAIKHWLPLSTFALLAGCLDNNIDTVREARFDKDPAFTIGEALDHRPLCESTSWDEIKDSKSRTVVEYRCEMKGAHEYFEKRFAILSEKIKSHFENVEARFEQELKSAQGQLATSEESIALYSQSVTESEGMQESARVVELRAAIATLQSTNPTELANVRIPSGYSSVGDQLSQYEFFKRKAEQEMDRSNPSSVEYYTSNVNDAEAGLKEAVTTAIAHMQEELQRKNESDQQYARETAEQSSQNLQNAKVSLEQAKAHLKDLQSKRDAVYAQIAAQREDAMKKLRGYTDVEGAYEVYQWTPTKEKDVYLSYIGVEINYADGEKENRSDPDAASIDRHLRAVLNDSFKTYAQYVDAGLPGSGIKPDPQLLQILY